MVSNNVLKTCFITGYYEARCKCLAPIGLQNGSFFTTSMSVQLSIMFVCTKSQAIKIRLIFKLNRSRLLQIRHQLSMLLHSSSIFWWSMKGAGPHILTVPSSEALAIMDGICGFQLTQFTVRVCPVSSAMGSSLRLCQM